MLYSLEHEKRLAEETRKGDYVGLCIVLGLAVAAFLMAVVIAA